MFKNWKKYTVFLLLVLVIVGVFLYYHYRHQPVAGQAFTPPPVIVTLGRVKVAHWPMILQGTGTVTAQQGVLIRAQVAGQVLRQFVASSVAVKRGTLLYQIDPQGLSQLIRQNEAQVTLKQEQLLEQRKLYQQKFVSKNAYDKALAAYKVAVDTLKQNQQKLALTKVTAPFSGRLGVMLVHQGDFVNLNTPLVSLQNPNDLRVDFTLPGNHANLVKIGQKVMVEVLQYPNRRFVGAVVSVNTSVNTANQSILVRAHLNKSANIIMPGSFANVQLYAKTNQSVLVVPQTALVYSDSGVAVYRVVNGVAHLTPVLVGQRFGESVAITRGLQAGQTIVAVGKVKLMDGMRVQ